jgi:hypothetical protein
MGAAGLWFTRCARKGNSDEVLERVAERAAKRFRTLRSVIKESLGLHNLTGDEKREVFRKRSDQDWAILRQVYPEDYKKQTEEWRNLLVSRNRSEILSGLSGQIDDSSRL